MMYRSDPITDWYRLRISEDGFKSFGFGLYPAGSGVRAPLASVKPNLFMTLSAYLHWSIVIVRAFAITCDTYAKIFCGFADVVTFPCLHEGILLFE
jgi:hypothetical protein